MLIFTLSFPLSPFPFLFSVSVYLIKNVVGDVGDGMVLGDNTTILGCLVVKSWASVWLPLSVGVSSRTEGRGVQ